MKALESELGVPIWEEGRKRGMSEGYFLPPITFTIPEAFNIFVASRLTAKTFFSILPQPGSYFYEVKRHHTGAFKKTNSEFNGLFGKTSSKTSPKPVI